MVTVDSGLGFVVVLAIILFLTKFFGLVLRKMGLPQVLGFILAGILMGPSIFGEIGFSLFGFSSGSYSSLFVLGESAKSGLGSHGLEIFAKIGVLLLMFSTGLETNLKSLRSTGLAATLIACAGVAVPMGLGILVALCFPSEISLGSENIVNCIFVGAILTATSVAITVSVLKELGKVSTKLGTTIVSAAIIDDVIGIVVLSVITAIARSDSQTATSGFEAFKATPFGTIVMIIAFFAVAIAGGFGISKLFRWMDKKWPHTHRITVFALVTCFVYAWLAEEVFGVADVTGAFLAGIVLSTVTRECEYVDKKIQVCTYSLFSPVFFANIGITSISFEDVSGSIIVFALLAVLVGLLGKIVGCGAVAKCFGYDLRESTIAGVGMMARGEVALIVTSTALASGMDPKLTIMTVLLILFSSIFTPILLKLLYKKEQHFPSDQPI